MSDSITIFHIKLDTIGVKETMKRFMQFMEGESLSVIEIITLEMMLRGRENAPWKEQLESFDLCLPGDREILESRDVESAGPVQDPDIRMFFRMLVKYLERNRKSVFLLADGKEDMERFKALLRESGKKLRIAGEALILPDEGTEERLVNEINGAAPDCILSVLDSPGEEDFVCRRRDFLDARVWIGCRAVLNESERKEKSLKKLSHFLWKKIFRYQAEKEKK